MLSFGLRGERQAWGAEDTAFVFLDTFKAPPATGAEAARRGLTQSWLPASDRE